MSKHGIQQTLLWACLARQANSAQAALLQFQVCRHKVKVGMRDILKQFEILSKAIYLWFNWKKKKTTKRSINILNCSSYTFNILNWFRSWLRSISSSSIFSCDPHLHPSLYWLQCWPDPCHDISLCFTARKLPFSCINFPPAWRSELAQEGLCWASAPWREKDCEEPQVKAVSWHAKSWQLQVIVIWNAVGAEASVQHAVTSAWAVFESRMLDVVSYWMGAVFCYLSV